MTGLNIVNIQGTLGATAQIERTSALEAAADRYGWNILEQQPGEYTQQEPGSDGRDAGKIRRY